MTNEIKEILDRFYNEYPKCEKILEKYITNLQQRIDKAIEYIESELVIVDDDLYFTVYSSDGSLDKLYKILKGE